MVSCPHGESQAEAGARSGRGGEAPRLGDLEDTMTTEQKACKMMGYTVSPSTMAGWCRT